MRAELCVHDVMCAVIPTDLIPDVLFSDNGPQRTVAEFKRVNTRWKCEHETSSPGCPQCSGKVESAVKTAQRLMAKENSQYGMLDHCNTASQGLDNGPVQSLMGQRTKTLHPMGWSAASQQTNDGQYTDAVKMMLS